jgi:hypothetical protein
MTTIKPGTVGGLSGLLRFALFGLSDAQATAHDMPAVGDDHRTSVEALTPPLAA